MFHCSHSIGGFLFNPERFDFIHPVSGLPLIGNVAESDRLLWCDLQAGRIPASAAVRVGEHLQRVLAVGIVEALADGRAGIGMEALGSVPEIDPDGGCDGDPDSDHIVYSSGWEAFGDFAE